MGRFTIASGAGLRLGFPNDHLAGGREMDALARDERLAFGDFYLEPRSGRLFRRDAGSWTPVPIGSRAVRILRVLLDNPGAVVSKDAIMDAVWPGTAIEPNNLTVQISALRRVLDTERSEGSSIQTVPGRGYRFIIPVVNVAARLEALAEPGIRVSREVRDPVSPAEVPVSASPHPLPLPDKPSLAVLPFQNMSGDPEQEYFADGMAEEIVTALSRIRWLFVIARNSSFTYKDQVVDVKKVGRELGVRYVLEGSVRKARQRVRITAQLVDATSGAHLWADRFDGSLEDVFGLQDKVAVGVAGVIEPTLQAAEIRRSSERPTNDLTAYDLYLRALAHWGSLEQNRMVRALELLGQAIERDPQYGPALALAAHCHQRLEARGWTEDPEATRHTSVALARQALRISPDDPEVLALVAFLLGYFGEDIDVAIGLIDRCLTLNPGFAAGWHWSGILRLFAGQPDLALDHLETGLRLSPRDRLANYLNAFGEAHFFGRRFDDAVTNLLASLERAPGFPITYRVLAASYAHMGQLDEAREIIRRLRAITPAAMERGTRYRNPELRELFLSGLRCAASEAS
jgi:TolB-like protein/DNA-binding winged helix-turn-helix (wHTH) protein/tetratricopeptide (TPR) repeat protein